MAAHFAQSVTDAIRLGWLTGPIFDKELRVSSRRRRNYVLRFFYILLLTAFVAMVWWAVVRYQGNAAVQQSRMEMAAQQIVVTISLFQFVAMQLLAIIMLSDSISDEVYHRTLGLLMTTPISGLQIVMGKLLSKLLQLVLLLAISLPMLAIVRVFGGISWGYLLSSLLITLTAAIFVGSVTLLFSIEGRRAYAVIIKAAFVLGVFYFFVPAFAGALWQFVLPRLGISIDSGSTVFIGALLALCHLNPFYGMWDTTREMLSATGGTRWFYWPVHCAAMLALSALLFARAVAIVRKVALWQATGQLVEREAGRIERVPLAGAECSAGGASMSKRVYGPPVVWRELRAPFIQGMDNKNSRIGLAITILALLLTYLASQVQGLLDENFGSSRDLGEGITTTAGLRYLDVCIGTSRLAGGRRCQRNRLPHCWVAGKGIVLEPSAGLRRDQKGRRPRCGSSCRPSRTGL